MNGVIRQQTWWEPGMVVVVVAADEAGAEAEGSGRAPFAAPLHPLTSFHSFPLRHSPVRSHGQSPTSLLRNGLPSPLSSARPVLAFDHQHGGRHPRPGPASMSVEGMVSAPGRRACPVADALTAPHDHSCLDAGNQGAGSQVLAPGGVHLLLKGAGAGVNGVPVQDRRP